jgi:WD40 repeat protein
VTAAQCTTLNERPVATVCTSDGKLYGWDLLTGSRLDIPFADDIGGVKAMACIHLDEQPVAIIVNNAGDMRALSLATGRAVSGPPTSEPAAVNTVACCHLAGQPVVVTGSNDGKLRIRDLPLLRLIREQLIGGSPVTAVTCGIWNGHPVAIAGSIDGVVRIWDIRDDTHQKLATMPREVNAIRLTAQGDLFVGFGWEVACLRNSRIGENA